MRWMAPKNTILLSSIACPRFSRLDNGEENCETRDISKVEAGIGGESSGTRKTDGGWSCLERSLKVGSTRFSINSLSFTSGGGSRRQFSCESCSRRIVHTMATRYKSHRVSRRLFHHHDTSRLSSKFSVALQFKRFRSFRKLVLIFR